MQVHEFTIVKPDDRVIHLLGLHEHSFTYYVSRSHIYEDSVLDIQYIYYPVEIFRDIRLTSAETSNRAWIAENYEVTPDTYHKTLRAVCPTDKEVELLGVTKGDPLLRLSKWDIWMTAGHSNTWWLVSRGSCLSYQTVDSESLPV